MAGMTATATPTNPPPVSHEIGDRLAWRAGLLGALNIVAAVLAARLILLVAVIGAIVLAYIVIVTPDPWRLGALAIYAFTVVIPSIWLASHK